MLAGTAAAHFSRSLAGVSAAGESIAAIQFDFPSMKAEDVQAAIAQSAKAIGRSLARLDSRGRLSPRGS